ncbi:MAG: SMC-Scp complex subunit ScpB [Candidatus Dormibacteria bacterium]
MRLSEAEGAQHSAGCRPDRSFNARAGFEICGNRLPEGVARDDSKGDIRPVDRRVTLFKELNDLEKAHLRRIAADVRRQRQALRLTLTDVAVRAGVSVGFLSMLERGSHRPSFDRLQRVQDALGLTADESPPPPGPGEDDPISLLGAALATGRKVTLHDLSHIDRTSIARVRSQLHALDLKLRMFGLQVVEDGAQAQLVPRSDLSVRISEALKEGERIAPLTPAQYEALAIAAQYGVLTRRQLEGIRGVECSELLAGLVELNLLSSTVDSAAPGRPLIYRLTTRALTAFGAGSVEELRAQLGIPAAP